MATTSEYKEITYDELLPKVQDGSVVILDVRNPDEVASGKIPGAVNIPLPTIPDEVKGLTDDQFQAKFGFPKTGGGKPIVVHCRAGGRAKAALDHLTNLDVQNDYYLYTGSWLDWTAKGGPVA